MRTSNHIAYGYNPAIAYGIGYGILIGGSLLLAVAGRFA